MYEDPLTVTLQAYRRNSLMVRTMPCEYEEPSRNEKRWHERKWWLRCTDKPVGCAIDCVDCFHCPLKDCAYEGK